MDENDYGKYIKENKKYDYSIEDYDNNSAINFLQNQLDSLKKIKTTLLDEYEAILSNEYYCKNANAQTVINDINKFKNELNSSISAISKKLYGLSKGATGEDKINDVLFSYKSNCKYLQNIVLNIDSSKIESDFIVITRRGVVILEVKNIGTFNETLNVDELGRVSKIDKNGAETDSYDMINQNNRHNMYLTTFLKNQFDYDIPVRSAIAIVSKIKIDNKSTFKILGPNQIYKYLDDGVDSLNDTQVKDIYELLLNSKEENKKYSYINYEKTFNKNYKLILKSLIGITVLH